MAQVKWIEQGSYEECTHARSKQALRHLVKAQELHLVLDQLVGIEPVDLSSCQHEHQRRLPSVEAGDALIHRDF